MATILKSFGVDTETGLEKQVELSKVIIDIINKIIEVQLVVNLIYPSGKKQTIKNISYRRFNADGNMKFDNLEQSQIGQGILGLIQSDFDNIESFETIDSDLQQI